VTVAQAVKAELTARQLATDNTQAGEVDVHLTDVTEQLERLEQLFYGLAFGSVKEAQLSD